MFDLTVPRLNHKILNNMVNYNAVVLDNTFHALADPTRRAILTRLSEGKATVSEIAKPFPMSLPAVYKHLKVLEHAGLLSRKKEGRTVYCDLNPAPLSQAAAWIQRYEQFWESQFDALASFVENHGEDQRG